jgi:hypothetical protein
MQRKNYKKCTSKRKSSKRKERGREKRKEAKRLYLKLGNTWSSMERTRVKADGIITLAIYDEEGGGTMWFLGGVRCLKGSKVIALVYFICQLQGMIFDLIFWWNYSSV